MPNANERKLLALLERRGEACGIDLLEMAKGRFEVKRGSLYVVLGRMEKKGWVSSKKERAPDRAIPRRFYKLTPKGIKELSTPA